MQTVTVPTRKTGVLHVEGGWPKEINPKDEEVVKRYRRRVEKDDNWAPRMRRLMMLAENCIRQNNAVNIYQNYFDDLITGNLVKDYDVRTKNVYDDPEAESRPISHLSWSPGTPIRLAGSYSYSELELERLRTNVSLRSYIWDIENPTKPLTSLKPDCPVMTIEYNPRDPSMLISGLMSGQVCNWDIRSGDKPAQISHLLHSHRRPTNQVLWTSSKSNAEFFSSSPCGTIKWWDVRKLVKPTETIVMDIEEPKRSDITRAFGVTALQFEPAVGSKFLAGLQNGTTLLVNRKASTIADKLAVKFDSHHGPVIAIDRNPSCLTNFLTIGDWCVKVWADDTREGSLLATWMQGDLTGGCWSRSRYSVFFTINTEGLLEVHDILAGAQAPLITFHVCRQGLTAIAPHEEGQLLAVGSRSGSIYLVQCSDALTTNLKTDKSALIAYLDRRSRFEKQVDNRLKEIRLMHRSIDSIDHMKRMSPRKGKEKKESKEKRRSKDSDKSREKSDLQKKKSRVKKIGKLLSQSTDNSELMNAEQEFFRIIEEETGKISDLDFNELEMMMEYEQGTKKRKTTTKPATEEKPDAKKDRSITKVRSKRKLRSASKSLESRKRIKSEDEFSEIAVEFPKSKKVSKRLQQTKVCPVESCKPDICCKDLKVVLEPRERQEARKSVEERKERKSKSSIRPFFIKEKWYRRLSEFINSIPDRSPMQKRQVLLAKNAAPHFLREEVERAKKELELYRRRFGRGSRDSKKSSEAESRKYRSSLDEGVIVGSKVEEVTEAIEDKTEQQNKVVGRKIAKHRRKVKRKTLPVEDDKEKDSEAGKLNWSIAHKADQMAKNAVDGKTVVYPRISAAFQPPNFQNTENEIV